MRYLTTLKKSDMNTIAINLDMTSNVWSVELHLMELHFGRHAVRMASIKGTPKKFYKKRSGSTLISSCRLCNCVADPDHSKNLFRDTNQTLLRDAESIYGGAFTRGSDFPHLICRPCERRLKNAIHFKEKVSETQRLLQNDV